MGAGSREQGKKGAGSREKGVGLPPSRHTSTCQLRGLQKLSKIDPSSSWPRRQTDCAEACQYQTSVSYQ